MHKINFGIIGYGRIGSRHAQRIHENPGSELKAVSDNKTDQLEEMQNLYTADSYSDYHDLLRREDISVVSICTPNNLHGEMTVKSAEAGKHILCEKPMALHVKDCQMMIDAAEKNGVKLFVVKQNRYNPPVSAVKRALDEGRLGQIYQVVINVFWNRHAGYYSESDWKGRKKQDGGTLYTQISHFIDLMLWFTGDFKSVNMIGTKRKHAIEFEDSGSVLVDFVNGAFGTINYSVCAEQRNMEGSITIVAEKGTVKIGGQYLNTLEYEAIAGYKIPELEPSRPANNYGLYQGSMSNHDKVIENVIQVLQRNGDLHVTPQEGMQTVDFIEKSYATIGYSPDA